MDLDGVIIDVYCWIDQTVFPLAKGESLCQRGPDPLLHAGPQGELHGCRSRYAQRTNCSG
jgi:hypothetical protein